MKKFCLLFLLIAVTKFITAQQLTPSIIWQKCLGGTGEDKAKTIIQTVDNGFLIGGYTKSNDGDLTTHYGSLDKKDAWIVKLSSAGNILWQKNFGGSGDDEILKLIATSDGNYIGIGTTNSNDGDVTGNHGGDDAWMIKIDRYGNLLWQKCFGSAENEKANSGRQVVDGGYIIVGNTSENKGDIYTIKTAEDGELQWEKSYGGSLQDVGYDIEIEENGYLLGAASDSRDGDFSFISGGNGPISCFLQIDDTGNFLNGSADDQRASILSIKHLQGNDYIYVRNSLPCYPNPSGYGTFFSRLTVGDASRFSLSNVVSYYKCAGSVEQLWGYSTEGPDNIIQLTDEQYIVSMSSDNSSFSDQALGYIDAILGKFDLAGKKIWQKNYGGSKNDYFSSLIKEDQYTYVACGSTLSNDGDVSGNHGSSDFWIVKVGQTNLIKGLVFADYNTNNIKDNDEPFINNIIVESQKINVRSASSTHNGAFNNSVDTGVYSTQVLTPTPYYTPVPDSKTSTFTTYNTFDSISFALQPIPGKRDYQINILPAAFLRPGFRERYLIKYTNVGTDTFTDKNVTLIIDKRLNFVSSIPAQSEIQGDTIKWLVPVLLPRATESISVEFEALVPPYLNIQDTIVAIATIDSTGDLFPSDNVSWIKQAVTGSYDPNDKLENRSGIFSTREVKENNYLIYTIRFQNTGNDTAFNVRINDTLPGNVDLNSLEMIAASHPYNMDITGGNEINWAFRNINLVDRLHNEPGSHGFVSYRIKPKSGLKAGETINNSASIYFDFNPPIRTNEHVTTIKDFSIDKPKIGDLKSNYCKNLTVNQQGRIINMPSENTAISVTLDKDPIKLNGNLFTFNVSVLSIGSHTILIIFRNGQEVQTSSFIFSVTEPLLPHVKLAANISTVSSISTPLIITATNVSGGGISPSYLFSKERDFNTSIQPESNNNILNISSSVLDLGINWIYVKMKTSENCYTEQFSIDSIRIERVKNPGLVDEDFPDQLISVYPNPIKQSINISGLHAGKDYIIIIYDALGKEVYKKLFSNNLSISIIKNDLQNGKYLLSIYDSRKKKLIGSVSLIKL